MLTHSSPRYAAPHEVARPRGARLLEAFSLKLNRRIRLFDRAGFDQWVRLEADPQVLSLCERPARLGPTPDAHLIDFWVLLRNGEHLLVIGDDEQAPQTIEGVATTPVCSNSCVTRAVRFIASLCR